MLRTQFIGETLKGLGYEFYSGVPCSYLQNMINFALNNCQYIIAANEGDAVAACAGAYVGGKKSVMFCQNSGLTNATSPLTSLNFTFQIPLLGFVSLRGDESIPDEPQHELMGKITASFLSLIDVSWDYLSSTESEAYQQLQQADDFIKKNRPFFFIVKKDTFTEETLCVRPLNKKAKPFTIKQNRDENHPRRCEVIESVMRTIDSRGIVLATTGKTARELYAINDRKNNFYMVGSMGCIGSFGLGLALAKPGKDIIVLDGDGSLLMHMGSLATNGFYDPHNMLHILLDNNSYDSTGGQDTVASHVDFVNLAAASGYSSSLYAHDLIELEQHIKEWQAKKRLTFIHIKIKKGSMDNLGRPTIKPYQVKERIMEHLCSDEKKLHLDNDR